MAFELEVVGYTIALAYCLHQGIPFSAFGEFGVSFGPRYVGDSMFAFYLKHCSNAGVENKVQSHACELGGCNGLCLHHECV